MKFNSITVKLGVTIMVLFLVVLFPLVYTIDQMFTAFYINQKQEQLENFASKYSTTITSVEDVNSYHMFEMLSELMDTELFVFNMDGEILKSTGVLNFTEGTNVTKEIYNPIAQNGTLGIEYKAASESHDFFLSGKPIMVNGKVGGGLVIVSSMEDVDESIEQVRLWLLISVIGALFIAIGFTFFVSKKLSNPLLQMEQATREIAKGKLKTKLMIPTKDEVGSLATAITDLGRELEEYRTNRREFFANISHELRTPISYIKGYSEVLTNGLVSNEEERNQYLTIITEEAKRLTTLINDLFELAKMEEGKIDLNYEWLDIGDALNSSAKKVSLKAAEKKIEVRLNTASDYPLLYTDGVRLEQIIINLIENAIRYSPPESRVEIYTKTHKQRVEVFIQDFGMGIPEEDAPFIFERFYRVEKSRSRASGGTGLGLAIVKNLVQLLGGEIKFESTQGKGTLFKIAFPTNQKVSEDK
ncbi:sensor histidine kinase [Domibacillus robiginosus]|uniref:sensor histidine kinase n=1 Tax=Domibacillus robiginosus TaxID=1071054 RepID=UPI00067DA224|nr:HAMP domain-containing sensor histidine kinase [Domibacillus robiginosus]